MFLVRAGGGAMHADMKRFHFRAPAVLTVPCRCIHAFEFEPDTSGFVATIGEAHLRRIVRQTPGLERLFDAPSVKTIEDDTALARDLSAIRTRRIFRGCSAAMWACRRRPIGGASRGRGPARPEDTLADLSIGLDPDQKHVSV